MCIISSALVATALGLGATITTGAAAGTVIPTAAAGIIAGVANTAIGLSVAGGLASGIMGGISSYQQGKAQQAEAKYKAQIARQNAQIAEQNARETRQQGIEEARLQRIKATSAVGSQTAAMAANGLDVTQGTPLDVIEDTAAQGELDALTTSYNYERKAQAYEQQAGDFRNQANLDIIQGQNAYKAGTINALSTGIRGLSDTGKSVADIWYKKTPATV